MSWRMSPGRRFARAARKPASHGFSKSFTGFSTDIVGNLSGTTEEFNFSRELAGKTRENGDEKRDLGLDFLVLLVLAFWSHDERSF